jgi:uncharacterized protein YqjF (DUF2071 family)
LTPGLSPALTFLTARLLFYVLKSSAQYWMESDEKEKCLENAALMCYKPILSLGYVTGYEV